MTDCSTERRRPWYQRPTKADDAGVLHSDHAGVPEDCVGAALLLASKAGGFITEQVIEINNAMSMP